MSSIPSIDKCPKCGSSVVVVGWELLKCTNPNCKCNKKDNYIVDKNIYHD